MMLRTLLLCTALLAVGTTARHLAQAPTQAPTQVTSLSSQPMATLQGRMYPGPSNVAPLPQLMTWPASAASFSFVNTSVVNVTLNGTNSSLPSGDNLVGQEIKFFPWSFVQFDLDGQTVDTVNVSANNSIVTWSHPVSSGEHNLTVTKISEAYWGAVWLQNVTIDPAGAFLPPPATPGMISGRRMMFVGDSYTVGFCNLGTLGMTANSSDENALLGYGPTAARHYNADYQVLAWSGAGVNTFPNRRLADQYPQNVEDAVNPEDPAIFYRMDALNTSSNYSLQSWVPQIVVLAGGTNDFHNITLNATNHAVCGNYSCVPIGQWVSEYVDFVRQVQAVYPQATIINLVFPFEVQLVGVLTANQTTIYLQYLAAASSALQAARLNNVFTLQLDGSNFQNTNWCSAHPNAATDIQIADQLIQFVDAVYPTFSNATFTATAG